MICPKCQKPDGPFYESANLKKRGVCRPCHRAATKATDTAHPDAFRLRQRRHYHRHKKLSPRVKKDSATLHLRKLLNRAHQRCKRNGREISITLADLAMPTHCPVLGIPLRWGGRVSPNSPTLDRIDNARGYVPGNVAVISYRANSLKRNATIADLKALLAYMGAGYSDGEYEVGSPGTELEFAL